MEILDLIIKWVVPTILTTFFGFIMKELKDNKMSNLAMKESMVLVLRSQIVGKTENYMKLGYLPDYARNCLSDLFKQYTVLGGNHGVDSLVDQCFKLPPIKIEKVGKI